MFKSFNELKSFYFLNRDKLDIYDHIIYAKTEKEARKRFKLLERYDYSVKYWNDPDYLFDWTEGEFS